MRISRPIARARAGKALTSAGRGLLLALLALTVSLPLFIAGVLGFAYSATGIGILITPAITRWVRGFAERERRRAAAWSGVRIASPYRPRPDTSGDGAMLRLLRSWRWVWGDSATWRDLLWLFVNIPVGLVLGLLPAYLVALSVQFVLAVPMLAVTGGSVAYWWVAFGLGVVALPLTPFAGGPILKAHARFSASLLSPAKQTLAARVGALTESRSQVLDSSASELRRIERDLHDGAQTRIAALGLNIGLAEQLVRQDPDAAVALLAEARESSGLALADLRNLVRGIHPPVLAERGLDGAIRALALTVPLPVELDLAVPDALPAPIESAVYFALAEAFANAVKHGGNRISVHVRRVEPDSLGEPILLVASVRDDGRGGARVQPGGGLDGIAQRLAAFDGGLAVHSPAGGPTIVSMELPCA